MANNSALLKMADMAERDDLRRELQKLAERSQELTAEHTKLIETNRKVNGLPLTSWAARFFCLGLAYALLS